MREDRAGPSPGSLVELPRGLLLAAPVLIVGAGCCVTHAGRRGARLLPDTAYVPLDVRARRLRLSLTIDPSLDVGPTDSVATLELDGREETLFDPLSDALRRDVEPPGDLRDLHILGFVGHANVAK